MMHPDLTAIQETVSFLLHGNLDYEFRTTVVKELHNENDFIQIGQWLKGAKATISRLTETPMKSCSLASAVILLKSLNTSAKFYLNDHPGLLKSGVSIKRYQYPPVPPGI